MEWNGVESRTWLRALILLETGFRISADGRETCVVFEASRKTNRSIGRLYVAIISCEMDDRYVDSGALLLLVAH